ncbi:MAG: DUF3459 domain-containing protein, partial [Nocardioidaceae bacterium]|nr:DUF3459 domain-containing protein [Nocardioidaceae bacterium]
PPDEHGICAGIRHLVEVRASLPHLHASVPADVLDPRDPAGLLVARRHPVGVLLGAYNVADEPRHVPLEVLDQLGLTGCVDRITGTPPRVADGAVQLAPYECLWLTG